MKYSGFTFAHNCLAGGYPIREAIQAVATFVDEMVVVDMESDDGTRQLLESLGCRIIDGKWGNQAETTLGAAHALHIECRHENIIHFEADEVWDPMMVMEAAREGASSALFYRIQVEQNFQRIRWAPHKVHRIFQRGKATKDPARGHTSKEHDTVAQTFGACFGLIWDVCYAFRDNWIDRATQNAYLWGESPQFLRRTPEHFMLGNQAESLVEFLAQDHWTWRKSPFALPGILKPLVGVTKYG